LEEEKQNKKKLAKLRNIFLKTEKELNFSLTELIEEFRRVKNSAMIAEEKLIKIGVKRLNQMKMQIEENEERVEQERIRIERVFGEAEEMEMEIDDEEDEEWDSQEEFEEDEEGEYLDEIDDDEEMEEFQDDAFNKRLVTRKKRKKRTPRRN